ncbi:MAG TPA: hypothetical protein VGK99_04360 [Acidobacteriota bacterium]|jgi:hypothetical protein
MKKLRDMQARFLQVCLVLGSTLLITGQSGEKKWNFDGDVEGKPPLGFSFARTGQGSDGQWMVKKDDSAPSKPMVLAQTSQDKTDYRFPLAIAEGASYKDLALGVKFKTISGSVDQGAGLVFRLRDKDNYYVVRANALEDNFRLYHVVNGKRVQFAGVNFKVTPQVWHQIRVEVLGSGFRCYYDDQLKITAEDSTFKDAGKIGLWTKADSVIYFDDLTVKTPGGASALSAGKTLAQRLVDDLAKKHPELVRIGLHVTPPGGSENIIIASNVAARIGQKSDPEDLRAMKTGRPVVLKEGENFDVTLPLHDATGKIIGAIGLTFKPASGEQEGAATRRARAITGELEKRIPSRDSLFNSNG